jgi:hypothetical protein
MPDESGNLRLVPTHQIQLLPRLDVPQVNLARADTDARNAPS